MTRDFSSVAGRTLALGLLLLLGASLLPVTVLAQDAPAPILVSDAFEAQGDAGPADVEFAWSISQPDQRWRLEAIGPADGSVRLELDGPGRVNLGRSQGGERAALFDLALEPGEYVARIRRAGEDSLPFVLTASPERFAFDPEPNDSREQAVELAEGTEVTGRIARITSDDDHFAITIPSGDTDLREVTLRSESAEPRELCLRDAANEPLNCRRAAGEVKLPDLLLEPGQYFLVVRGTVDEEAGYALRIDRAGPRDPGREAEPNDQLARASALDPSFGVEGGSSRDDWDFHAVTIAGEPQLWRVEASGAEVDQLAWVRGDDTEVASSRPLCSGSSALLEDLYLVPGTHRLKVRACSGDYRIDLTPLGPRDPEAEREPNDDEIRAEAYPIGQRRTGRLATAEDIDHFRFTLAAPEHLRLLLRQPPDADFDLRLWHDESELLRQQATEPGADLDLDLWLPGGDYLLALRPRVPSEGVYELSTERLDPFRVPADAEPNGNLGFAHPAPPSLRWQGDAAGALQDLDAWWLPALTGAGALRIRFDAEPPIVRLFAGTERSERVDLEASEDGSLVAAEPPVGVPLFLELQAEGPYGIELDAPGWPVTDEPLAPPLELALELETDQVAAYWPEGQRLAGSITLSNTGAEEQDVDLMTATSHYAWQLRLAETQITLTAGETASVPVQLDIGPDVWAGAPVTVSVAAVAPDGGLQSASASIDAGPDIEAANPKRAWPVPEALLGGLNVASLALGGEPSGSIDLRREVLLFDDLTPASSGFVIRVDPFPLEIVVDLAGDEAVPVAGTILNPLAQRHGSMVRDFELLLSDDGETWRSVLSAELQPLPIDQSFVLEAPLPARQAMLRIHSLHGNGSGSLATLGEWKVVAQPGAVPEPMPTNIADPVRGGHVARHAPLLDGFGGWYALLDDEVKRQSVSIDRDVYGGFEMVIGFQEGRAAQIERLDWQDPDGSDEETRLSQVEVEVGLDGPLGPWQRVGTWTLGRDPDGSVAPFEIPEPAWARYVRLSSSLPPEEVRQLEFPGRIEVIERVTDDEYRSILGEWGYTSDAGPYEWLVRSALGEAPLGPDAGDTAAEATPLAPGERVSDRAEIIEDVDWYRIVVPSDTNTLTLDVAGIPTVGVRLSLFGSSGAPWPMRARSLAGGTLRYEVAVEPGASYDLLVEQPPFNVVFTYDTSGSMGPYLDFVLEGLREFAADVAPGREVAHIIPVSQAPLLEGWSDQPVHLEDAVNGFRPALDARPSNVELGLLAASELLRDREGTRAILVVADAETGTLNLGADVWRAFDEVQPIVYAVHVGADTHPEETRNLMRAWSDSNGGHYAYPTTHAEMDRAFERMSARLRRPATYALTATTSLVNRDPASLVVVAPEGRATALAPGVGVAIILDTSGSMRKGIGGKRRIAIARDSLREFIGETLAEGVPLSLRIFGGKGKAKGVGCETRLALPLAPLDREAALLVVKGLDAPKRTATPIAAALAEVPSDLEGVEGTRIVLLVTDGAESCGGDPEAAIAALAEGGFEATLNIVGFALDDEELKAQMAGWAQAGGGSYFDASGATELAAAIRTALGAPFRVFPADPDAAGGDEPSDPLAKGTVGGEAVTLEPGTYRVEVLSEPPMIFEEVVLRGGEAITLELPGTDEDG